MSLGTDNILLVTAGYDRTIRFWQANTAAVYRTIMHEDSVRFSLKFTTKQPSISLANELLGNTSAKNIISSW